MEAAQVNALTRAPMLRQVPLAGGWRPAWSRIGQLVQVSPDIKIQAPIAIELGGLPFSIGLFAGSGVVFLIRSGLPDGWPQAVGTALGAALAVAGITNLLLPKAAAAGGAPAAPQPGQPPSAPPGYQVTPQPGYSPSGTMSFENVVGRIVSPADFSTVDVGPFASSYPVRVQLQNLSEVPITLDLELTAEEEPHPVGGAAISSLPVQVNLMQKEIRNVDIMMPLSAWGTFVDYVDVTLTAKKRRVPGEAPLLLDVRSFVIE